MNAPAFTADHGDVFWNSVRLSEESVGELLTIFEREGAAAAHCELYAASLEAGHIPRVSNLRAA